MGIARRFAREGATILLAQRNADQGELTVAQLRSEFGITAAYLKTDVTKREQVDAMVAAAVERFGAIDILVNNAGGSFPKRLENHTDEDMAAGIDLNFWSTFWAMRAAFPYMKAKQWGRVINLGSLNGVNAHMFTAQYNVSKEAVRALSRTAAVEWGPHGITCNVICPAVGSPAADIYYANNPEMFEGLRLQIPRGRLGDPEADVGGVARLPGQRRRRPCQRHDAIRRWRLPCERGDVAAGCRGLGVFVKSKPINDFGIGRSFCIDIVDTRANIPLMSKRRPSLSDDLGFEAVTVAERPLAVDRKGTINLRIEAQTRELIDDAAAVLGKTRTEFMIDSARYRAIDVLLDQRLFVLDPERYDKFMHALDNPPAPGPKLRSLLRRIPAWQK